MEWIREGKNSREAQWWRDCHSLWVLSLSLKARQLGITCVPCCFKIRIQGRLPHSAHCWCLRGTVESAESSPHDVSASWEKVFGCTRQITLGARRGKRHRVQKKYQFYFIFENPTVVAVEADGKVRNHRHKKDEQGEDVGQDFFFRTGQKRRRRPLFTATRSPSDCFQEGNYHKGGEDDSAQQPTQTVWNAQKSVPVKRLNGTSVASFQRTHKNKLMAFSVWDVAE